MCFQGLRSNYKNLESTFNYQEILPQILPQKMSGKITYQVCLHSHKRNDGTFAIYVRLYQDGKQKKINLNIAVPKSQFDVSKQRIKKSYKFHKDYNLLIEKILADINKIMVEYRLSETEITIDKLITGLMKPGLRINFNKYFENLLEDQHHKGVIQYSTYKQQKSTLKKLKDYQDPILFSELDEKWLGDWQAHLKKKLNNKPSTVAIATKNFKKYLTAANEAGIKTKLRPQDVKVKRHRSNFTFLYPEEVKALHSFYTITNAQDWKHILQRYLFSCFTGLRLGDTLNLTQDHFIGDVLVFNAAKTGKLQRIKLNKTALGLIEFPAVFHGDYTEQFINRELKNIAKAVGITKRLYYHSSRHTFATNYLIAGGQLLNLQKLLGHSKIETTMIYSHVVDTLMDKEIGMLDGIIED